MFLAVSIAFAVLVVNAFHPVKREPFTVASFALGWIPASCPSRSAAVEVAAAAVLRPQRRPRTAGRAGWAWPSPSDRWPGWPSWPWSPTDPGPWSTRPSTRPPGGRSRSAGFDPAPLWNRWWRLVIAVPVPLARHQAGQEHRLLGRRELPAQARHPHPPDGAAERAPVLVYIHGGAWVIGDKREQGIPMMHELARRGWVCVAINYRLSPRATWPDHIVDCKRAVAWVREHIAEYGGDPAFIAVSGGSAGGHLSSLLALTPNQPEWQPGFEDIDTSVDACIPFYGVYDMTVDPAAVGRLRPRPPRPARAPGDEDQEVGQPRAVRAGVARPPGDRIGAAHVRLHGVNDTLVPLAVARHFVGRAAPESPRRRWPTSSCPGPSTPSTCWPRSGPGTPPWARSGSSRACGPGPDRPDAQAGRRASDCLSRSRT